MWVKSLKWSVAKWNKVKWSERSKVKWNEVKWTAVQGKGGGRVFMEKVYRSSKWWEVKDWGESVSELMIGKNNYKKLYTVLSYLGVSTICTCCILTRLVCFVASFKLSWCNCCWLTVCIVVVVCVVILCLFVVLCGHCCFFLFTLDAGPLARSQYSEGPATGHLDTFFSCFPCVYKQMLRWFPRFQVASTCFSRSPPDLNLLVINFMCRIHVK